MPLSEVMNVLSKAVFDGDPAEGPDSVRQNLQSEYVDRLIKIVNSSTYLPAAQSVAFSELEAVQKRLHAGNAPNKAFLLYKIRRGLDATH